MLPVEKAKGQIFLSDHFLCEVEYDISEPLQVARNANVQRIKLDVPDEHCATLLDAYNLVLVLANGQRSRIPRPRLHAGLNSLECYVETY